MRRFDATRELGPPKRGNGSDPAEPCIWAVGGGKGGVGKSIVASSLAIALAARGPRCAVVDADLGGANLHTLFGVPNPPRTLSHFLNGEVASLADVMCPTSVPDVWLVSGSRALLEGANPKHTQKQKFLRHIRGLGVGHVLLDLSAGSAFNVLDFFLAARRGILVVVPEPTSIENTYHFLKAAFYRSLRTVARHGPVRAALEKVLEERSRRRVQSPRELIAGVMDVDREAGRLLKAQTKAFSPMLIVNQADKLEHRRLGREIATACELYLGTEIDYLGALELDASVTAAVARQQPVLQLFPGCAFSQGVGSIADRLLRDEFLERHSGAEPSRGLREGPPLATHSLVSEEEIGWRPARRVGEQKVGAPAGLPPLDTTNPGGYLRQCREHLGLQLAELSHRTCIRRLDRIEEERFDELPPEPYLRQYVLQYARELGIADPERLAASFLERSRRPAPGR